MEKIDMRTQLIEGGLHTDKRGTISFINDFNFDGVVRFYTIRSHQIGKPRGWIGHRVENKWFIALTNNIVIAVVKPDDWERPSQDLLVKRFELNDQKPSVLFVPAGHATASIMLTKDALLGVFSSETFERSVKDDFRFDITTWIVNV